MKTLKSLAQTVEDVKVEVMETFRTFESCIRILYSLLRLQNEIWEGKPIASF